MFVGEVTIPTSGTCETRCAIYVPGVTTDHKIFCTIQTDWWLFEYDGNEHFMGHAVTDSVIVSTNTGLVPVATQVAWFAIKGS